MVLYRTDINSKGTIKYRDESKRRRSINALLEIQIFQHQRIVHHATTAKHIPISDHSSTPTFESSEAIVLPCRLKII